ncbi:MAG: hypothetical protein EOM67_07835 [Spirochaetia bacterium]|nr:hypothetical protein [Spirochaetia bacterium]
MRVEKKNPIVEIQETTEIVQGGHSLILEKGDKVEVITAMNEATDYYDPNFYGTSVYYKSMFGLKYTESIKSFAKEYEAY